MPNRRCVRERVLAAALAVGSCQVGASTINIDFAGIGWQPLEQVVVLAARDMWQAAIISPVVVDLSVRWGAVPAGAVDPPISDPSSPVQAFELLGVTSITAWNALGAPAAAEIVLNSSYRNRFFVDPTPYDSEEFVRVDFPGALIDPRLFEARPGTVARNRYDLLSLVAHEMGHGVGFTNSNPFLALQGKCIAELPMSDLNNCLNLGAGWLPDPTEPLELALEGDGFDGPGDLSRSDALNEVVHFAERFPPLKYDLMTPIADVGLRNCPSVADIAALNRAYGYQLNVSPWCPYPAPAPGSAPLVGIALAAMALVQRARYAGAASR